MNLKIGLQRTLTNEHTGEDAPAGIKLNRIVENIGAQSSCARAAPAGRRGIGSVLTKKRQPGTLNSEPVNAYGYL